MKWATRFFYILIFIASMFYIVTGQRNIGPAGLGNMLLGLAGILILVYLYNRKYQ